MTIDPSLHYGNACTSAARRGVRGGKAEVYMAPLWSGIIISKRNLYPVSLYRNVDALLPYIYVYVMWYECYEGRGRVLNREPIYFE